MKHLNIYFAFLFILGTSQISQGSHLVGGDISYEFVKTQPNGDLQYLVKVTVIKDGYQSTVDFDIAIEVGIYFMNDKKDRYKILEMTLTGCKNIKPNCLPTTRMENFQEGVYEKLIDLPRSQLGYLLTWERCCRTLSKNIENKSGEPDVPFYFICQIPGAVTNTSAHFQNFVRGFCTGKSSLMGTSHFDKDGDSVVVALVNPIKGLAGLGQNQSKPVPTQTLTEPNPITYNLGYHYLAPFGSNTENDITVNTNNVVESTLSEPGTYYLAFEIREYRNGILITSRIVDVLAIGFACSGDTTTNNPTDLTPHYLDHFKGRLQWSSCENQVSHYVVYRSKDNQSNYNSIGSVPPFNNQYIDSTITSSGIYHYYVEGVGLTGKKSAKSNEVFLRFNDLKVSNPTTSKIRVFPNPTTSKLTVTSQQLISKVELYDMVGIIHNNDVTTQTQSTLVLDTKDLPAGFYTLSIEANKQITHVRIIKQ